MPLGRGGKFVPQLGNPSLRTEVHAEAFPPITFVASRSSGFGISLGKASPVNGPVRDSTWDWNSQVMGPIMRSIALVRRSEMTTLGVPPPFRLNPGESLWGTQGREGCVLALSMFHSTSRWAIIPAAAIREGVQ